MLTTFATFATLLHTGGECSPTRRGWYHPPVPLTCFYDGASGSPPPTVRRCDPALPAAVQTDGGSRVLRSEAVLKYCERAKTRLICGERDHKRKDAAASFPHACILFSCFAADGPAPYQQPPSQRFFASDSSFRSVACGFLTFARKIIAAMIYGLKDACL